MPEKSCSQRLLTINETKMKIVEHNLEDDVATKVLWGILDTYHKTGKPVHTELVMQGHYSRRRKYVVDLYNDTQEIDRVLIRTIEE